ncbi:MAG: (2Fe-2S)-binding protein [Acidiferrobacterales bacterium]|nr:(2Fe-2S)-binding protein [Acidiferrobacterales bacterium]
MFVCLCKAVTDHQIHDAVDAGVTSFETMQQELGVASVCGSCTCEVKQLMTKKFNQNLSAKQSLVNPAPLANFKTS